MFSDIERGPVPQEVLEEIADVQAQMNQQFTWTYENLSIEMFRHSQIHYDVPAPRPWAARLGYGFIKVRDDHWNAALTVRFLRWLSTRLPEGAFIRLHDEGAYVMPEHVILTKGAFSLDVAGLDRWQQHLQAHAPSFLYRIDECKASAVRGEWLRPIPVLGFIQGRREMSLAASWAHPEDLDKYTLEDAADCLVFPWQKMHPIAA